VIETINIIIVNNLRHNLNNHFTSFFTRPNFIPYPILVGLFPILHFLYSSDQLFWLISSHFSNVMLYPIIESMWCALKFWIIIWWTFYKNSNVNWWDFLVYSTSFSFPFLDLLSNNSWINRTCLIFFFSHNFDTVFNNLWYIKDFWDM